VRIPEKRELHRERTLKYSAASQSAHACEETIQGQEKKHAKELEETALRAYKGSRRLPAHASKKRKCYNS
jgi:hypothetical protein